MKPNNQFTGQPKYFWSNVRTISQQNGYTLRGTGQIRIPSLLEIKLAFEAIGLDYSHILSDEHHPTEFGSLILAYFKYRADTLNSFVRSKLMNAEKAKKLFEECCSKFKSKCVIPMNKQKGEKKAPAYFTGIINMIIESEAEGFSCDFDPRELTIVTRKNAPLRTLARRVDGAFMSPVNPIAIWEIKEYYYTKTFGSRVADGVYETLLDGMELEELREHENIDVKHYLMIDDYFTWWDCGRSYLCRIIDMLHMSYVDEVIFGSEVVESLPRLVKEWVSLAKAKGLAHS